MTLLASLYYNTCTQRDDNRVKKHPELGEMDRHGLYNSVGGVQRNNVHKPIADYTVLSKASIR